MTTPRLTVLGKWWNFLPSARPGDLPHDPLHCTQWSWGITWAGPRTTWGEKSISQLSHLSAQHWGAFYRRAECQPTPRMLPKSPRNMFLTPCFSQDAIFVIHNSPHIYGKEIQRNRKRNICIISDLQTNKWMNEWTNELISGPLSHSWYWAARKHQLTESLDKWSNLSTSLMVMPMPDISPRWRCFEDPKVIKTDPRYHAINSPELHCPSYGFKPLSWVVIYMPKFYPLQMFHWMIFRKFWESCNLQRSSVLEDFLCPFFS